MFRNIYINLFVILFVVLPSNGSHLENFKVFSSSARSSDSLNGHEQNLEQSTDRNHDSASPYNNLAIPQLDNDEGKIVSVNISNETRRTGLFQTIKTNETSRTSGVVGLPTDFQISTELAEASGSNGFADIAYGALALSFLAIQAGVLTAFGQPTICRCGYVKLWDGNNFGEGNSQHLTDWYTFSHILHGILFYGGLHYVAPNLSIQERFLIALGVEVTWEIAENSPIIIQRYRNTAASQDYMGDSIVNSISDSLAMSVGFPITHSNYRWFRNC